MLKFSFFIYFFKIIFQRTQYIECSSFAEQISQFSQYFTTDIVIQSKNCKHLSTYNTSHTINPPAVTMQDSPPTPLPFFYHFAVNMLSSD